MKSDDVTVDIVPYQPEMLPRVIAVWNAALGGLFPLRETVFVQNATASAHFDPEGLSVAVAAAQRVVGMSLAKVAREPLAADGWLSDRGWISLIAVHPSFRGEASGGRCYPGRKPFFGRGPAGGPSWAGIPAISCREYRTMRPPSPSLLRLNTSLRGKHTICGDRWLDTRHRPR